MLSDRDIERRSKGRPGDRSRQPVKPGRQASRYCHGAAIPQGRQVWLLVNCLKELRGSAALRERCAEYHMGHPKDGRAICNPKGERCLKRPEPTA